MKMEDAVRRLATPAEMFKRVSLALDGGDVECIEDTLCSSTQLGIPSTVIKPVPLVRESVLPVSQ